MGIEMKIHVVYFTGGKNMYILLKGFWEIFDEIKFQNNLLDLIDYRKHHEELCDVDIICGRKSVKLKILALLKQR